MLLDYPVVHFNGGVVAMHDAAPSVECGIKGQEVCRYPPFQHRHDQADPVHVELADASRANVSEEIVVARHAEDQLIQDVELAMPAP